MNFVESYKWPPLTLCQPWMSESVTWYTRGEPYPHPLKHPLDLNVSFCMLHGLMLCFINILPEALDC